MKPLRVKGLPENIRRAIKRARLARDKSQRALGESVGLAQYQISGIETGKVAPRYDTLIEILRMLDLDLVLVPRELLSAVQGLLRDYRDRKADGASGGRPLYAADGDDDDEEKHQPELGDE